MCAPHPTTNPTRQAKPTRPGSGSEPEPPRLHPPAATPASGREPHSPARRRAHCPRARSSSVHRPHATGARRQVVPRARAPSGAQRSDPGEARSSLPPSAYPTWWGGLAVFTASPTVSFRGARRRAPLRSARRSRQGGTDSMRARGQRTGFCSPWSAPAVAGAAPALPHWARTFRAPAGAPSVGLGLLPLGRFTTRT